MRQGVEVSGQSMKNARRRTGRRGETARVCSASGAVRPSLLFDRPSDIRPSLLWGVSLFLLPLLAGCSSGRYWPSRGRDALDMVTLAAGSKNVGGLKLRLGPANAGFYKGAEGWGLRDGDFMARGRAYPEYVFAAFGIETFPCRTAEFGSASATTFPFVSILSTRPDPLNYRQKMPRGHAWSRLTQVEAAAGAGATVRLGLNPGEMADFIVGWAGLDLYGDDEPIFEPEPPPKRDVMLCPLLYEDAATTRIPSTAPPKFQLDIDLDAIRRQLKRR